MKINSENQLNKYILLSLQLATTGVFLGRAYQHLFWDAPFRSLFWDANLMTGLVETFSNYTWREYVTSPQIDQNIQTAVFSFGILYLLCGIIAIFIQKLPKRIGKIMWLGSAALIFLAMLYMKEKFLHLGQFLEYTLQFSAPVLLYFFVYKLQNNLPPSPLKAGVIDSNPNAQNLRETSSTLRGLGGERLSKPITILPPNPLKGEQSQDFKTQKLEPMNPAFRGLKDDTPFWLIIKIAIALTFTCHGLYAIGYYPRPEIFLTMTMNILGVSNETAILFLQIAGILDFIISIGLFLPWQFAKWCWIYAIFWGFATSIARIWGNFYLDFWQETLNQWTHEMVMRFPHFLIPLAGVLYFYKTQKQTREKV